LCLRSAQLAAAACQAVLWISAAAWLHSIHFKVLLDSQQRQLMTAV
jgi:hypothetical protein